MLADYIGVIIASTTHKQLLLISPITLPLLNVQWPIIGFYAVVPWLFVLFHFDLLLQFYLLADKLRVFQRESANLPDEKRLRLRKRLSNFSIVQMLAGEGHDSFIRLVLGLVVWITVLVLPLWLLVWVQLAFLLYHSETVTGGNVPRW